MSGWDHSEQDRIDNRNALKPLRDALAKIETDYKAELARRDAEIEVLTRDLSDSSAQLQMDSDVIVSLHAEIERLREISLDSRKAILVLLDMCERVSLFHGIRAAETLITRIDAAISPAAPAEPKP